MISVINNKQKKTKISCRLLGEILQIWAFWTKMLSSFGQGHLGRTDLIPVNIFNQPLTQVSVSGVLYCV